MKGRLPPKKIIYLSKNQGSLAFKISQNFAEKTEDQIVKRIN
jgi:hypothetical protein